jgi:hypothetical protein
MKPLEYLFYRALSWKLRNPGERFPFFASVGMVAVLLSLNVLTLIVANDAVGREHSLPLPLTTPADRGWVGAAVWGGLYVLLRSVWIHNGRYRAILDQFANESTSMRMRRTVYMWSYIVISVCAPFAMVIAHRLSA